MHAEERETKIQSVACLGQPKLRWPSLRLLGHLTAHLRNAVIIHSWTFPTHARLDPFSASLRRRPLLFPTLIDPGGTDDALVPTLAIPPISLIQHTAGSDDAPIPSSWRPGIRNRERIRAVRTAGRCNPSSWWPV
jgi:hypothetical protein